MNSNHQSSQPQAGDDDIIQPLDFQPAQPSSAKSRWRLSPVLLLPAAALVVVVLIMGYLVTARSLYVSTNAEQPHIHVDGRLTFRVGDRFLLLAGEHEIKVRAEGYYPWEGKVVVGSDTPSHTVELQPLPGHLVVESQVPAEVLSGGTLLGKTNERLSGLSAGEHELTIQADRYQPVNRKLVIEGRDIEQHLSVELQPDWANITITSTPAGATVTVDGEELGVTPLTAELVTGQHELEVKLAGHKVWQQNLRVQARKDRTLANIRLVKANGLVKVVSSPAGASITVNGQFRGNTPAELALTPGKTYNLTLFKSGYQAHNRQLKVVSGKEETLNVDLAADLGTIVIEATPADAQLYVDGKLMGEANQSLSLPARQHSIRVMKAGFADYTQTVTPRPGLEQKLSVQLLTNAESQWRNIPEQLKTAAGQTLLLFRPDDTFTMGASRREQGRRANEAQHHVKLDRAFYLSDKLVTNAEFRRFEKFHSSGHVQGNSLNGETYPVVNISWQQAALYCNWLSEQDNLPPFYQVSNGAVTGINETSTGYRLPTEAEWEWAARLKDGQMLKFAWGNELPPPAGFGNFADRRAAPLLGSILLSYDDGFAVTSPVGKFPPNHRQLYDLSGNAAEWINDYYGIDSGLSLTTEVNPLGPAKGDHRVIRGSSWAHGTVTDLRLAFRDYGSQARSDVGFRVARFAQ